MSTKILQKKLRRFFNLPQKGETYEFRSGLVSKYADERKDTIQRVIAAMTTGKDVSGLFPLVLQNIATHDLQQKKLVYLYLMNYAKTHPELVILATNTFVIDSQDPNPLIRALAIRTMGCIRVDKMVDYMAIPLKRTLEDDNPYVRKTAAICVSKLFELNPQMCLDHGFLEQLVKLVDDSNQMVVANAVASLMQLMKTTQNDKLFVIDNSILTKFLVTLNECSEWGRVSILKALADFDAKDANTVKQIIDNVSPQLQHENPAVVLNSIKILINQIPKISYDDSKPILKRLSAPLSSLMSCSPEIQYVALKNIRILLEIYPSILDRDLRAFFVHHDDPAYLKLEKIEILVRIVREDTAMILLSELREYAMEVDTEVVSRAIHGLCQLALKVPSSAKKSVDVLYELFINRPDYVLDDCVIACEHLLRRFQSEFLSSILSIITSSAPEVSQDTLSSAEAKSSYIWIIGQYASSMPYLDKKLQYMVDSFVESEPQIQIAVLTTLVKISLTKPTDRTPSLLQSVLKTATNEIENADVRDKAYIYWRLLSADDATAKDVILAPVPQLNSLIETFPEALLNILKTELGMLGSIYYRPGSSFVEMSTEMKEGVKVLRGKELNELSEMAKREIIGNAGADNLLDIGDDDDEDEAHASSEFERDQTSTATESTNNVLDELNDLFAGLNTSSENQRPSANITNSTNETKKHADLLDLF